MGAPGQQPHEDMFTEEDIGEIRRYTVFVYLI
jgi:hypothetical protein